MLGLTWGQSLRRRATGRDQHHQDAAAERTQHQRDRLLDYFLANAPIIYDAKFAELKICELRRKLDELKKTLPPLGRAPGVMQAFEPRATHVHVRGDFRRHGDEVTPALPRFADGQADGPAGPGPLAGRGRSSR